MKKDFYISQFKDKKITVMGLGVLGRGLQVTQFLAECGAKLTVTDLKTEKELATSLRGLKKYKIRYVLGKHEMADFEDADIVLKAAGVPLDSPFIAHARSQNIPVVMDASLFATATKNITPQVTIVGVTGTRGKSMTTALIYHALKTNEKTLGCKIHLGGNMRAKATLPLLKIVAPGDIVVLELDSWQLQGFGDEKISPHISVFTNLMPDHMNYYKNSMKKYLTDKTNIFKFQKKGDILVTNKEWIKIVPKTHKGNVVIADTKIVEKIPLRIFGDHNTQNASYAYAVAQQFGLTDTQIQKSLKTFKGLEGRLQYLGKVGGKHIVNDNNATTPTATEAGIQAIKSKYKTSSIILITGGADKNLDLECLINSIQKHCAHTVLLPGTGTERLKKKLNPRYTECTTLKEAVTKAFGLAKRNDVILFSPGFASFGLFTNEYDRGDQFLNIIKSPTKLFNLR